jgi:hypothetical protein
MARTTHVAKAQQRYETVPVIDPETGQPKKTPVMRKVKDYDTGEVVEKQKTTKTGRLVFMTVTERDLTKPLPLYTCDHCHQPIQIGTPYKHITPKSGPYGGRKRTRHESCPGWQVWDYSNSLSAQLARISFDFWEQVDGAESTDDVQSALDDASAAVEEIGDAKAESAQSIEDGFGHATEKSEELESIGEQLKEWADSISSADIPEIEDCATCDGEGKTECVECDGTGQVDTHDGDVPVDGQQEDCSECSGTGQVECTECDGSGEDLEGWRDQVRDAVTIVDESPV